MSDKPYTRIERDERDRITGIGITSSGRQERGATGHPDGWNSSDGDTDRNAGEDVTRDRRH